MARTPKFAISEIVEELKNARGLVYIAAKHLHCAPSTIYRYANKHAKVKETIDIERGLFIDIAESALMNAVANGEKWAVEFTLKYLGRDRGYSERSGVELSGPGGGPIKTEAKTELKIDDDTLTETARILSECGVLESAIEGTANSEDE